MEFHPKGSFFIEQFDVLGFFHEWKTIRACSTSQPHRSSPLFSTWSWVRCYSHAVHTTPSITIIHRRCTPVREGWTCCLSMLLPSMETSQPQRRHRTHLSATALCCFRTSASVAHRHAEINTVKWSVFGYFNNFLKKNTFFPKRQVSYKNSLPEKKLISLAIFFFDSKKPKLQYLFGSVTRVIHSE